MCMVGTNSFGSEGVQFRKNGSVLRRSSENLSHISEKDSLRKTSPISFSVQSSSFDSLFILSLPTVQQGYSCFPERVVQYPEDAADSCKGFELDSQLWFDQERTSTKIRSSLRREEAGSDTQELAKMDAVENVFSDDDEQLFKFDEPELNRKYSVIQKHSLSVETGKDVSI